MYFQGSGSLALNLENDLTFIYTLTGVPLRSSVPRRTDQLSSCCTRDEGGPLGIDVKAWVPNRLKLLWSRAMVVSVKEKVLH